MERKGKIELLADEWGIWIKEKDDFLDDLIKDVFDLATCSGVPLAITFPPISPPSGPRSII